MQTLANRIEKALPSIDEALRTMGAASGDDDGKARSLFNDLQYLRARYQERLIDERREQEGAH